MVACLAELCRQKRPRCMTCPLFAEHDYHFFPAFLFSHVCFLYGYFLRLFCGPFCASTATEVYSTGAVEDAQQVNLTLHSMYLLLALILYQCLLFPRNRVLGQNLQTTKCSDSLAFCVYPLTHFPSNEHACVLLSPQIFVL